MSCLQISVSELNSYLRCRRAWDWTSSNRQGLKHKATPKLYFVEGSGVHEAIHAQASGKDPYEALELYIQSERETREQAYRLAVGSAPWQSEMEDFETSANLARCLVAQYFNHYGQENPLGDLGLKYVATEVPFSIALSDDTNFVGTFDGIATDIESESKFYLLENKTTSRKPNLDLFERSNQSLGYNWAFWALTGQKPVGTIYNLIMKRPIKPPKTLKSGALSVDKNASVTLQSFMAEIERGGHNPLKYIDYINMLSEREAAGDDRFFLRQKFQYTQTQLDNWHNDVLVPLLGELRDPPNIAPNYLSCENCLVKDLCEAKDRDHDVDSLVSQRYKVGKTPTEQSVHGATPVWLSSTTELVEYLKGIRNDI